MGRYPHYRGAPSSRDKEIVSKALDLVDMAGRRRQPYPTLSGGNGRKRIWHAFSPKFGTMMMT